MPHSQIDPAILYWGTPVVLITTLNEDGSANIAPMSSAWWLGDRCMLGLAAFSQTTANLTRTKQCVLNLPSDNMVGAVNALARTTGTVEVPAGKLAMGYRHVKDKFAAAWLTPQSSELVSPPRIEECPVQMETELVAQHQMFGDLPPDAAGFTYAFEVRIRRTHVIDKIRLAGHENRIDPDVWRPMIMMFQQFYGLHDDDQATSSLAEIDEESYRLPDGKK